MVEPLVFITRTDAPCAMVLDLARADWTRRMLLVCTCTGQQCDKDLSHTEIEERSLAAIEVSAGVSKIVLTNKQTHKLQVSDLKIVYYRTFFFISEVEMSDRHQHNRQVIKATALIY